MLLHRAEMAQLQFVTVHTLDWYCTPFPPKAASFNKGVLHHLHFIRQATSTAKFQTQISVQ
jgi:hypothetical protein